MNTPLILVVAEYWKALKTLEHQPDMGERLIGRLEEQGALLRGIFF